jgi:hypothetical protein
VSRFMVRVGDEVVLAAAQAADAVVELVIPVPRLAVRRPGRDAGGEGGRRARSLALPDALWHPGYLEPRSTHLFADGGGRELAYVAMSRAREATHAWVVADDLAQAAEDLGRDWSVRRTPTWALGAGRRASGGTHQGGRRLLGQPGPRPGRRPGPGPGPDHSERGRWPSASRPRLRPGSG